MARVMVRPRTTRESADNVMWIPDSLPVPAASDVVMVGAEGVLEEPVADADRVMGVVVVVVATTPEHRKHDRNSSETRSPNVTDRTSPLSAVQEKRAGSRLEKMFYSDRSKQSKYELTSMTLGRQRRSGRTWRVRS